VQLRWKLGLTSEEYVTQQAWHSARLDKCPLHPKGGCGFHRLGTYERLDPAGAYVPRWYCPTAKRTFSLLADCLAARLPGSLRDVEGVVSEVERLDAVEAAAHLVRGHDVELPGAIRWTRRRVNAVRAALSAVSGLMHERFGHCQPTLASFRQTLGVELVLPALRNIAADHLATLPPPLGFAPPSRRAFRGSKRAQHFKGSDPPPKKR
jgi:hypothetical protein